MAQNLLSPGAAMNMATSHDQSQPRPPMQPHIHFKELTPESIHSQTGTPVTSSSTPALSTSTPAPVTVHPSENPQVNVEFPDLGPHNVPQQIHVPRKLVLCFDGTGNKFHGDDSDSNILKLFRMLDRTAHDQFHYYQPGIGTYVQTDDLSHTGIRERCKAWIQKAKDSAIGSSFDQHVVGGYRFLMRYYNHGDEIYIFGFSRGAYIARFLSEMLDMVGLLSHGNEEMIYFAWKTFSQWQCRSGDTGKRAAENKHKMYDFMKGFRETFSRPVRRIRFLGLFDTVNSVPRFETAWMQRSKFPYTARSKAKVIRHAVSIDERRAKFRQDLIYQARSNDEDEDGIDDDVENASDSAPKKSHRRSSSAAKTDAKASKADASASSAPAGESSRGRSRPHSHYERYRCPSRSRSRAASAAGSAMSRISAAGGPVPPTEFDGYDSEDDAKQDIDEVWFSGGHGDVGGGWDVDRPGCMNISHVPLTWMVREASRAGLRFDVDKVIATGCAAALKDIDPERAEAEAIPDIQVEVARSSTGSLATEKTAPSRDLPGAADESGDPRAKFHDILHKAETNLIHDSLVFGGGLSFGATLSWRIMEYLPFRRMDLQSDGTWKPIRWPLPRGETRDMPRNSRIHGSVIRRMQQDLNYRPGNLVIGGGGRGVRVAPASYGMGEWVCVEGHGDPVAEIYVRRG